jgi:hypothetical protein
MAKEDATSWLDYQVPAHQKKMGAQPQLNKDFDPNFLS